MKIPRYRVSVETSFVIHQASRRIHVCDDRQTALRICRKWNAELRQGEPTKRTATKARDAKRAVATVGAQRKKLTHKKAIQ